MKIPSIITNIKTNIQRAKNNQNIKRTNLYKTEQDTFIRSENSNDNNKNFTFINRNKFNIKDYKKLTTKDINTFRNSLTENDKNMIEKNIEVGLEIKKELDDKYGEDNYIFVSVGTSASGIGRVLEFSGVETKYLPISNLKALKTVSDIERYSEGFVVYNKFLKEQGIHKNTLKETKKYILFYDYTCTGISLDKFEEFLKKIIKFPVNSLRVEFRSLNEEIEDLPQFQNRDKKETAEIKDEYIRYFLQNSEIGDYGGIPHLFWTNMQALDYVLKQGNAYSKKFNFGIIDELSRRKQLKYNPRNEHAL